MLLSLTACGLWAGVAAAAGGPMLVARVPVSIPTNGVTVSGVVTLLPARGAHGLLPTRRAVVIAEKDTSGKVWQQPRALRATVSGSVAIAPDARHTAWKFLRNAQAWVVTFTATKPQRVGQGPGGGAAAKHMTVVIDARDGRFIRGFFTA